MNYRELCQRMVEEQLMPRGISSKSVLDAFREVPRHEFVPPDMRQSAYEDYPLPIGEGQTISQPFMVALMTQCLDLKGNEKVLEIGTGSGYQAAILSRLAKEVYSIERIDLLAKRTEQNLKRLGYAAVKILVADGTLGWKENSPYNAIIVTAAAPKIPPAYTDQLALGGKLVIPVGTMTSQVLAVVEKKPDGNVVSEICGCVFVPLVGEEGWKR